MTKVDSLIRPYEDNIKLLHRKGDTDDIINVVLRTLTENRDDVKALAKTVSKDYEGLKEVFNLVKDNIEYQEDPDGGQWIQTPAYLWHKSRIGDCKSFTVFIASILHHMGISYIIRFVSFDSSKTPSHVYPIAILKGKKVIMDAVYTWFDAEKPYQHKKDFALKALVK